MESDHPVTLLMKALRALFGSVCTSGCCSCGSAVCVAGERVETGVVHGDAVLVNATLHVRNTVSIGFPV